MRLVTRPSTRMGGSSGRRRRRPRIDSDTEAFGVKGSASKRPPYEIIFLIVGMGLLRLRPFTRGTYDWSMKLRTGLKSSW